ncbi:hypothetical protein AB0395_23865 [Streptosporangium sp. NPDC051023]|uniref:hypothetical protein n=1 Tax=Streptosporangium sp. NPDC051023 TaxID=3155410 RepID=UPI00344D0A1D
MKIQTSVITSALLGCAVRSLSMAPITGSVASTPEFSVARGHAALAFDATDDRKVAGWADDVFIGKVVAKQEQTTAPRTKFPLTLWSVEVVENFKGDLSGTVTVSQYGGYDAKTNTLRLMEEDTLLEPGQQYVFATNANKEKG